MARGFRLAPRAVADLVRAEERFFEYAGRTPQALKRHEDLIKAVYDLQSTPATWPASQFKGVRQRVVSGCKIFYRVTPDTDDNSSAGDVRVLHIRLPGQQEPKRV